MSAIDCYKHEHIGWVQCPMKHEVGGRLYSQLPVYRLLEAITEETTISGQKGDVVIGGGSGEASALSFAIPELFQVYTHWPPPTVARQEPITCHWRPEEAFYYCTGFEALGWDPVNGGTVTSWLAGHLMAFLLRSFPDTYGPLAGTFSVTNLGGIFSAHEGRRAGH